MTTGLLANMHHHLTAQPSTADSMTDSIPVQRSQHSPAVDQPPEIQHTPSSTVAAATSVAASGVSGTGNGTADHRHHNAWQSPQRPLFTVLVETES